MKCLIKVAANKFYNVHSRSVNITELQVQEINPQLTNTAITLEVIDF